VQLACVEHWNGAGASFRIRGKAIVTTGQELSLIKRFLQDDNFSYFAADVVRELCPQLEFATACA